MIKILLRVLLALCWCTLTATAYAGLPEGINAYRNKHYTTALQELKPLAEQGDAQAQFMLGLMHALGQGVRQDFQQAMQWYRRAARKPYAPAEHNLGVMYDLGHGVPQNFRLAALWYRRAAEHGYAESEYSLGTMYETGQGVNQDYTLAIEWYDKAAEHGNVEARHSLDMMFEVPLRPFGGQGSTLYSLARNNFFHPPLQRQRYIVSISRVIRHAELVARHPHEKTQVPGDLVSFPQAISDTELSNWADTRSGRSPNCANCHLP
ncbi:MAG: tetratricopeptide repeat protein [Pseudomonadota bacterium]